MRLTFLGVGVIASLTIFTEKIIHVGRITETLGSFFYASDQPEYGIRSANDEGGVLCMPK